MKFYWPLLLAVSVLLTTTACDKEDDGILNEEATFTVTIENVLSAKPIFQSGTTDVIMPGNTYQFSFDAGKGHRLSLATMFVQTNDVFLAPNPEGIQLYDNAGKAITGDITNQFNFWDAGTEVNQEPGVGSDQAPRQSGPNVGTAENSVVKMLGDINDGFTYPGVSDIASIHISHDGGTEFTVTIDNVSSSSSLATPLSPGIYAVHSTDIQLFTIGEAADNGIEEIAEDGNNSPAATFAGDNTGFVSGLAPGAWAVHEFDDEVIFDEGEANKNNGLEELAEDANPALLDQSFAANDDVSSHGIFNTPVGTASPGPAMPGQSYQFSFTASERERLSIATMLGNSNDLFYAFGENGLDLFENGQPIEGDITDKIDLWDAGTEVNEFPGAGNNQAPRQTSPGSGTSETGNVDKVNDSFTYPADENVIRISITASQ